jgi:AcrR family transcriptional regulator
MPRTGLSPQQVREKAIDLTIKEMRRVGFEKVRLTDIAKKMGVSHAALYTHFQDKTALLDAVSDQWLIKIDEELEAICRKSKDPCEKIQAWMLALHHAKVAKVRNDPELYRAFDFSTQSAKPFSRRHLDELDSQLMGLVEEAISKRKLRGADPSKMAKIIRESMMSFHHPKLVAQHIDDRRDQLLIQVLDSVLKGLKLRV